MTRWEAKEQTRDDVWPFRRRFPLIASVTLLRPDLTGFSGMAVMICMNRLFLDLLSSEFEVVSLGVSYV